MDGLAPFLRWLRAPLRVHWSWPRSRLPVRGGLTAQVLAVRLVEPHGPDLELHNVGPGAALDIEIATVPEGDDDQAGEVLARIPVLGPGARYIVTLSANGFDDATDQRLQVAWCNRDGSADQTCWDIADRRQLTEVPCP